MSETDPLLKKAQRAFDAAERLLSEGDADFAVSRAYYGCFYVAQALLRSEGIDPGRHGQVIAQYGLRFAKSKRLDPEFHRFLSRAFQLRQGADYVGSFPIAVDVVQEVIDAGRSFLSAATEFLKNTD